MFTSTALILIWTWGEIKNVMKAISCNHKPLHIRWDVSNTCPLIESQGRELDSLRDGSLIRKHVSTTNKNVSDLLKVYTCKHSHKLYCGSWSTKWAHPGMSLPCLQICSSGFGLFWKGFMQIQQINLAHEIHPSIHFQCHLSWTGSRVVLEPMHGEKWKPS